VRPTSRDDVPFILRAEQDPDTNPWIGAWTAERHTALIEEPSHRHLIVENDTGDRVGYALRAVLGNYPGSVELARMVITEKGSGFGRAAVRELQRIAFDGLDAHRLCLDLKQDNARARHVYETAGFIVEGVFRECVRTPDGYETLVNMSMLEQEYRERIS
jgi:RimJ/RimL family protein N-acetyltransferase